MHDTGDGTNRQEEDVVSFENALRARTADERNELIEEEINDHFSGEQLDEYCKRGGFAEFDTADDFVYNEDDVEITVRFGVTFTEVTTTGCAECSLEDSRTIYGKLTIRKDSGEGEYSLESSDDDNDDFFPGDYN
jgi:hypothetical protein